MGRFARLDRERELEEHLKTSAWPGYLDGRPTTIIELAKHWDLPHWTVSAVLHRLDITHIPYGWNKK